MSSSIGWLRANVAVLAMFAFAAGALPVTAATVTWDVAGSGDWDLVTPNWAPGPTVYANGDATIFNNAAGGTINIVDPVAPLSTTVSAASGTYTFSGAGITNGTLTKSNAGTLVLENDNTYSGVTNVLGGTLEVAGSQTVTAGSAATTIRNGSTMTVSGAIDWSGTSSGAIFVGNSATAGTLNVTAGGSITFNRASDHGIAVAWGNDNTGTFNIAGDVSLVSPAVFYVASSGTGATGTVNVSDNGTLSFGGPTAGLIYVGGAGNGTLNISDNAHVTVSNVGASLLANIFVGVGNGVSGTVNLDGGMLSTIRPIAAGSGSSTKTLNLNGGTLQALGNQTNFIQNLTRTNVRNGGAVLDTNDFNVTIAQALLHSSIDGDNAIDGGLTKIGGGTLTLTAANTYTGATTLSAGTLALGATASIADSSGIFVESGSVFDVSALAGGFGLVADQILGGSGTVVGDIDFDAASVLQVTVWLADHDVGLEPCDV